MSGVGVYPADERPELLCDRCLRSAQVDWCRVTMAGDPRTYVAPGRMTCRTVGCIDARGSSAVLLPPTVHDLAARGIEQLTDMLRRLTG